MPALGAMHANLKTWKGIIAFTCCKFFADTPYGGLQVQLDEAQRQNIKSAYLADDNTDIVSNLYQRLTLGGLMSHRAILDGVVNSLCHNDDCEC